MFSLLMDTCDERSTKLVLFVYSFMFSVPSTHILLGLSGFFLFFISECDK